MKEKYEFHPYCLLFPKAPEAILNDMSDDIVEHGLKEDIIIFEGRILDGRNRQIACEMANVEARYIEYDVDKDGDPLQYVISKNLHRRHLNESQRGMAASDVYELAKNSDGAVKMTLDQIAKRFNVSLTTVKEAGKVKESASETVQQKVRDGTTRLNKAVDAVEKTRKTIGIAVTKTTPPEEKQKAHEMQERILKGEAPPLLPTPPTPVSEFQLRVASGEFNGKRWQKNIAEMQTNIATLERFPALFHDSFDLIKTLDQQALLNTLCNIYIDVVQKIKAKLQQGHKADFKEVQKFFADIQANRFPSIENDFGAADKKELNEHLKDQLIDDCNKTLIVVNKVLKKLMP